MVGKPVTREKELQIIDSYNRLKNIRGVVNECHTSSKTVARVLDENNIKRRKRKPEHSAKTCKTCKKKIDIVGAKFCPYCGCDLRDPIILKFDELLAASRAVNKFSPPGEVDKLIMTINELRKMIFERLDI